jgi:hypothetical protein
MVSAAYIRTVDLFVHVAELLRRSAQAFDNLADHTISVSAAESPDVRVVSLI